MNTGIKLAIIFFAVGAIVFIDSIQRYDSELGKEKINVNSSQVEAGDTVHVVNGADTLVSKIIND